MTNTNNYSQSEIDTTVSFFVNRGWGSSSAINVSSVLLSQSKKDNISVSKLIEILGGLSDQQINEVVAGILNSESTKSVLIGYRKEITRNSLKARSIIVG